MFAVVGTWTMDDSRREEQEGALPQLVASVQQNPGFIRGFWAQDIEEPSQNVTFIVFEAVEQARAFRDAVRANAPAQETAGVGRDALRIVDIRADA